MSHVHVCQILVFLGVLYEEIDNITDLPQISDMFVECLG